ncbi:hypothetical protein AAE478_008497 [Parahypoxylon ruwenzoriense]
MDPRIDLPAKLASASDQSTTPVDGPRDEHISQRDAMAPALQQSLHVDESNTTFDLGHLTSPKEESTVEDLMIPLKEATGENHTPPQENSKDALPPIAPSPSQPFLGVGDVGESSVVGDPRMPLRESADGNLATLRGACQESHETSSPTMTTPSQPKIVVEDLSTPTTAEHPTTPQKPIAPGPAASPRGLKRPRTPTLPAAILNNTPKHPQRDYIISHIVKDLKAAWQQLIELRGQTLGSKRAVHTHFNPSIRTICVNISSMREEALLPSATPQEVADAAELAMVEELTATCQHVIGQYAREMRRDLVAEARAEARAVKEKVLAAASRASPEDLRPLLAAPIWDEPLSTPEAALNISLARLTLDGIKLTNILPRGQQRVPPGRKRQRMYVEDDGEDYEEDEDEDRNEPRKQPLPKNFSTPRRPRQQSRFPRPAPPRSAGRSPTSFPFPLPSDFRPQMGPLFDPDVVGRIGPYLVRKPPADAAPSAEGGSSPDPDVEEDSDDVFGPAN